MVKAQEVPLTWKQKKSEKASQNLTSEANEELGSDKFVDAEATYRKAISKNGENVTAKYNLGNAYYKNKGYREAFSRYKQAGEIAGSKTEKHRAFHNMGNVFMQNKEYQKAVEAYKQALRNNPTDDETRYNLALAKKMLEQDQQQNDQNQDQDQQQNDQNKQDQQQGGGDENKEDQGDQKENKDDQGDQGDQQNDQNPEQQGDQGDQKKQDDQKGKKPKEEQGEQKPRQTELSPQQVKALLEAMNNEEKKVQEKLNAKKVRGSKTKNEKDW